MCKITSASMFGKDGRSINVIVIKLSQFAVQKSVQLFSFSVCYNVNVGLLFCK